MEVAVGDCWGVGADRTPLVTSRFAPLMVLANAWCVPLVRGVGPAEVVIVVGLACAAPAAKVVEVSLRTLGWQCPKVKGENPKHLERCC